MKKLLTSLLVFTWLCSLGHADYHHLKSNDTIRMPKAEIDNLFKYLKGKWKTKGTWTVYEKGNNVDYEIIGHFSGEETFQPILDDHFLQKEVKASIKYYSKMAREKKKEKFSSLTLFTFNKDLDKFLFWFFDSCGGVLEAKGSFTEDAYSYTFYTKAFHSDGSLVDSRYVIHVLNKNRYEWEVSMRENEDADWVISAKGEAERVGK